jgi:hypothetical protein
MKTRTQVCEPVESCPISEHQRIAYGWMVTALWTTGIAAVEALVILYLVWR